MYVEEGDRGGRGGIRVVDVRDRFKRSPTLPYYISRPSTSRLGQKAVLRSRSSLHHPAFTRASLARTGSSRQGQPSILRKSLGPGTTTASLAIQPSGRSLFKT